MKQIVRRMALPTLVLAVAACAPQTPAATSPPSGAPGAAAPAAPPAAPAAGAARSLYDGVYSAAQATRGQGVYSRECSSCHSTADFTAGRLLGAWSGRSVGDLVDHVRAIMPMDAPGRLSLQQYTDIMTYIFQLNNVPPGSDELPADEDAQQTINVEYRS